MTTSIPESPTATAPANERVGLRLRLLDPISARGRGRFVVAAVA